MKRLHITTLLKLMLAVFMLLATGKEGGFCSDSSSESEEEAQPAKRRRLLPKAAPPAKQMAQESDIELIKGKGSKATGGAAGGFFWRIMYGGKSAGRVFINMIEEAPPLGRHPSIQIFLNKASQGKHIGRIAYQRACNLSGYDEIYAYMAKKNEASYRSALAAGFTEVKMASIAQRLMRWVRR